MTQDPGISAHAWRRFRRITGAMAVAGVVAAGTVVAVVDRWAGPLPTAAALMIGVGVLATTVLGGALMTLLFLSHGTGHDGRAADPFKDQ